MGISIKRIFWSVLFSLTLFGTMNTMEQRTGEYYRDSIAEAPAGKSDFTTATMHTAFREVSFMDNNKPAKSYLPY
jgi:hypothetical protein